MYKQREREREYTQRVISRAFVAIVSVVRRTGGHPTSVHINRLSTGHSSLDFVVCLRVAVIFLTSEFGRLFLVACLVLLVLWVFH